MAQRRLEFLQAGRGAAALLVVMSHSANFLGNVPGLWMHRRIYTALLGCTLGVHFFFVLSGTVMVLAHGDDVGRPAKLGSFYWKRFVRIYPLYWLVLALTLLHHTAMEGSKYRDAWVVASSVLLFHLFSSDTSVVVAWTLFHEVVFYLAFGALLLRQWLGTLLLGVWFAGALAGCVAPHGLLNPYAVYWLDLLMPVHLLFGFGMAAGWLLRRGRVPQPRWLCVGGVVLFALCIARVGHHGYRANGDELAAGFAAMCVLLGGAAWERSGRLRVPPWLAFLGEASYSIYLVHFLVISALAHAVYGRWGGRPVPDGVWFALFLVVGTAVGMAVHVVVERPLLEWLRGRQAIGMRVVRV